jgi:hypothetical protein
MKLQGAVLNALLAVLALSDMLSLAAPPPPTGDPRARVGTRQDMRALSPRPPTLGRGRDGRPDRPSRLR